MMIDLQRTIEQEEEVDDLLTTRQAIQRINTRLQTMGHKAVSDDAFYQKIGRGKVPHEVVERISANGKTIKTYLFRPEDIDALTFRGGPGLVLPHDFKPVEVHNLPDDLIPLQKRFGRLVDTAGLIELLKKKTGHEYKKGSIKARRNRPGGLVYVAYSGSKLRKNHWYPASQVDSLNWQPNAKRTAN